MEEGRRTSEILGRALIPGILLTGTIGAGKTTIAEATSELLHRRGLQHALLDLDWLGQLFPAPDNNDPYNMGLSIHNIRAIWPNFRRAGAEHLVLAATIVNRDQLEALRSSLPDVDLTTCVITSSPELVARRIDRRNTGRFREDFLARTDALAAQIRDAAMADFIVTNEGDREAAANEVLSKLGWLAD